MKHKTSFLALICLLVLPAAGGEKTVNFYAVPSTSQLKSSCNGYQTCGTLNQYAMNSTHLFVRYTNYTLLLFSGVHVLTTDLVISGIQELKVCSNPSRGTIASIDVTYGNLNISNVSSLHMVSVQIRTTLAMVNYIPKFWLFDIVVVKFWDFHLVSVKALVCGTELHKLNSVFSLVNSSLSSSMVSIDLREIPISIQDCVLNKSIIAVESTLASYHHNVFSKQMLLVSRCMFIGHNTFSLHVTSERSLTATVDISELVAVASDTSENLLELSVQLEMWSYLKLNFSASNMTSFNVDLAEDCVLHLNVMRCSFGFHSDVSGNQDRKCIQIRQDKYSVAIVHVYDLILTKCTEQAFYVRSMELEDQTTLIVRMYNVLFFHNKRTIRLSLSGSINMHVYMFNVTVEGNGLSNALVINAPLAKPFIKLEKCSFISNIGYRGACIYFLAKPQSLLSLHQVSFYNNKDIAKNPAIVLAINCDNVTLNNVFFYKNSGTPLEVIKGRVILSGLTTFERNIARNGGGLALINSQLVLMNHSKHIFRFNQALDTGGAIYTSTNFAIERLHSRDSYSFTVPITRCFFQLYSFSDVNNLDVILLFENNISNNGGDDIYGTYIYNMCMVSPFTIEAITYSQLKQLFKIQNSKNTSLSAISSDPLRVCLCDDSGEPQCARLDFIYHNITAYPGERFVVPLVVVGEEFGTVTATAYANLLDETSGSLGRGQNAQRTNIRHCTLATYAVYSFRPTETIILTASADISRGKLLAKIEIDREHTRNLYSINRYVQTNEIGRQLLVTSVYLNVTLDKCPLGFELSGDPPSCQCQRELLENNIKHCIIMNHTGYVYRSGTTWLNATWSHNKNNSMLIVHKHCPYGYCLSENTSVDLRHPDTQCTLGHSGILCGGCQENFSLALGSNRCLECANSNHMTLLIFFSVAGFVLVFFIKALNLTVSKGTINGLVFYANIVWAEQSILFSRQSVAHRVINVFIAWLNLDLGIETCFARGLTAYQKVWLQFLFPVYVWCIVGVMILSSHYSTLATKLFGNNSVPVMATLFLISYAKLLRTIITVFGFAVLESANSTVTVWLFDGNVPYLGLQHVFLFIAAVLALLFLWLPYMFTLFVVPLLKSKTHYRPFRWIVKWKPFYDAYFGPFRAKHEYWIGVLLLVRVFLFVLFSTTSASSPNVNLLAIIIMTTCLLVYVAFAGPVYKSKYLSLLENSFFLNLNALAAGVLYENVVGGDRGLVVYVLVGIVVIEFVCITLYHCVITVKSYAAKQSSSTTEAGRARPRAAKKWVVPLREELLDTEDSL